jgi:hypothetical protein
VPRPRRAKEETMLTRVPAAAVAALLLVGHAAAAAAANIPGDMSTKATLKVTNVVTTGTLDQETDADWYRVNLTKGQDYAVRVLAGVNEVTGEVDIRGPGREVLKSASINSLGDNGFEFRAPYTGAFFVEVIGHWNPDYHGPQNYGIAVVRDCRGDAKTRCTLVAGKTYNVGSAWFGDYDAYAQLLDPAKRYTFTGTVAVDGYCYLDMKLLDSKGTVLASSSSAYYGDDPALIKDFKPASSGKYYLRLRCDSDDWGGKYSVGMTVR